MKEITGDGYKNTHKQGTKASSAARVKRKEVLKAARKSMGASGPRAFEYVNGISP